MPENEELRKCLERCFLITNKPTLDQVIEELAEEQGIKPGDWKIAAECARGIWPEDESLDDFLDFLICQRNLGGKDGYSAKVASTFTDSCGS